MSGKNHHEWRASLTNRALVMHKKDNVAVLLHNARKGSMMKVYDSPIEVRQNVPFGHKIAIHKIRKGEYVVKYGIPIGRAKSLIRVGDHVHVQNVQDITEELRAKTFTRIRMTR